MMKPLRKQTGFTLIELVLIVLIIGILASVAIPKYAGMRDEATNGVAKGVLGALRASNAILYAKNLAGGTNIATANDATAVLAGATVQGDITNLAVDSATQFSAVISGKTYTFTFTAPTMPTTMGIVGAATTNW